jgi:hypothetical protein
VSAARRRGLEISPAALDPEFCYAVLHHRSHRMTDAVGRVRADVPCRSSNSRRWHHEVFRWLDEWVGEGKSGAATTTSSESESGLERGPGLVLQKE